MREHKGGYDRIGVISLNCLTVLVHNREGIGGEQLELAAIEGVKVTVGVRCRGGWLVARTGGGGGWLD